MTEDSNHVEYATPSKPYLRRRLQGMDPYAFEAFFRDVWEHLGWNTRVVGKPGDRGIDVVATNSDEKQLIQAKRYGSNTTVGSPEVQQYASLRLQEESVDQVTIVMTGEFSRQAEQLAPDLDVTLVDGEALLDILSELEALRCLSSTSMISTSNLTSMLRQVTTVKTILGCLIDFFHPVFRTP